MRKIFIWGITILLAATIIAVTFIQLKWINEAIITQQKQFNALVNKILDDIIKEYELKEIIFTKSQEIISASPDSTLAFDIQNNPQIQKLLQERNASTNKFIIYQARDKKLTLNDYEFINDLGQKHTLYVAEINKTFTGKKINLAQRIDPKEFKAKIDSAFKANNIKYHYELAIIDQDKNAIFKTPDFKFSHNRRETFSKTLFPHTNFNLNQYYLLLYFTDQETNLFNTLPSLAISTIFFTSILLIVALITIILIFRQKRLSELKTQFVNNVSHELKTPIATIQLATQMLTDESLHQDPSKIKEITNIIKKENERMRFNVEKILQTSVIERGRIKFNKKVVNAHEILEKISKNFEVQVKQRNGLILKNFEAKDDQIIVDELHFTNVIINLLENALKYNEGEPVIEIDTYNSGKYLAIAIQDNGIGIDKKDIKKIFDQFYRAHDGDVHNYKSFGLGLNYVKKIIDEHNGKITVDSEPGQGSTFTIFLPLAKKNQKIYKNG